MATTSYVGGFEEGTGADWAKLAGFLIAGAIVHASAYFATVVLPLNALGEEKSPEETATLILPPIIEKEALVEVEIHHEEDGAGARAKEDEGTAGKNVADANKRFAVKGPQDNPDPHIAKQAALRDAMEFGMIGLLNSGAGGDPDAPTAPWGRDDSLGNDAKSARGNMWGDAIGDSFGAGGLGLTGIGEGGGGRGEGIGLGNIGTLGHGAGTGTGQGFGNGSGRLGGAHRQKPPSVRMGATSVSGKLPPEVVQRIVRQNFGRFRLCYENGLRSNPNLEGNVVVEFVIGKDGSVGSVSGKGTMSDAGVVSCVTKGFYGLTFPQPEEGTVKVTYPIAFSPGDAPAATPPSSTPPSSGAPTTKALSEMGTSDIERALTDAGCTKITSHSNGSGATVLSAKKGDHSFTITFVPAGAGPSALSKDELARLTTDASVRKSGGALLAIECDDKPAASALLAAMPR